MTEPVWADSDSLPGLIQRGRGACYDLASAQREQAAKHVLDCIVHDPRWDHQVEDRSWLYATLAAELSVDPKRFRAAYARPADPHGDSDAWLAVGTLEHLAQADIDGSVGELRHYLRTGRDLSLALGALLPFAEHVEARGLLHEVLEVADDEQLLSEARWVDLSASPWPQWRAGSARLDRILDAAERHPNPEPTMRTRTERETAERERVLAAAGEMRHVPAVAAATLSAEAWETMLLDVEPELLADETVPWTARIAARNQLWKLRSPRARTWAEVHADLEGEPGYTALSLLGDLGEQSDAPRLLEHLVAAHTGGDDYMYSQCTLVAALRRLTYRPAIPIIETVFDTTVYSYLRIRCAEALGCLSAEFTRTRAVECLTDCESSTREIAISRVDLSIPRARERLARIAADPMEEDENRRAAAARIS
ncbi:hypothetical protein GPX89_12230 [Nocardia sp. ET3-3]|uniref:HEAT repeat domain-containing protein n=1 Tax=Nocardia terrae TaxID=2675851 RepID=A0A7K1UUI0_9NOCA|nr:hypothetical protein [Nocardia terrae]MVU78012.1 hypothetical protein [Nocardia terrae]